MEQRQREMAQRMLGLAVTYEGRGNPLQNVETIFGEISAEDMMIGFLFGTWHAVEHLAAAGGTSEAEVCLRLGYVIELAKASDPFALKVRKTPWQPYEDAVRAALLLGAGFLGRLDRNPIAEFHTSIRALTASFVLARFTLQTLAHDAGEDVTVAGQRLLLELEA